MEPLETLRRIAFLLERAGEPTYKVRAFRGAAAVVERMDHGELEHRVESGTLVDLPGIGKVTAAVISEALAGDTPGYLRRLETTERTPLAGKAAQLRQALRGDLHTHSDWSDGGSPIAEMAAAARELGHDYIALTDHSPRLTVARGLSAERLRRQLEVVAEVNRQLAPFRILTGIEVDILEDGSLDQDEELLGQLDVVVASVHSKLRMDAEDMTRRMVRAIASPHVDVLGHCTGRIVKGGTARGEKRPQSRFEPDVVFEACRRFDVAVEINCRPERLDPPKSLLRLAVETGCRFAVDSDAHAPGQLDWQHYGCERATACGVEPDRVINTWSLEELQGYLRRS